jgi:hypothetical protein
VSFYVGAERCYSKHKLSEEIGVKKAFLALLLTVVMVGSIFVGTVAYAETPKGGTVDSIVANEDDDIFYTNETFKYTKNTANSGKVLVFKLTPAEYADAADNLRAYAIANASKALDLTDAAVGEVDSYGNVTVNISETDKTILEYYIIVEDLGSAIANDDDRYSEAAVVCVDTVIPTVDSAKVLAWLLDPANESGFVNNYVDGSDDFEIPTGWAEDTSIVVENNSVVDGKNDTGKLHVYLQYLTPSEYDNGSQWTDDTKDSKTFSLTTVGWWKFRFVVEDLAGNFAILNGNGKYADGKDATYVLELTRWVRDNSEPTVSYSSSEISNAKSVTAGGSYKIPTPTRSDVVSSVTTEYTISKKVGGEYVVIYDSKEDKVTEGYEDYTDGDYITPVVADVSPSETDYPYIITHTVTDAFGFSASATLNVVVVAPDATTDPYNVWKIVLICVAGVAAAGIVALLFIKPKEEVEKEQK